MVNDRVSMADGTIYMQVGVAIFGVRQSFHDCWRLAYLMVPSYKRLDGFDGIDDLDGMEGDGVTFL